MGEMHSRYGEEKGMEMLKKHFQDLKDHNLLYVNVEQTPAMLEFMKEMGFPLDPIFGRNNVDWFGRNFGGRLTFDNYMHTKKAAKKTHEFYQKYLGHNNVLTGFGDEQGAAFVTTHRNFHRYFIEYGIKIGCAGHNALFYKGGYAYGL